MRHRSNVGYVPPAAIAALVGLWWFGCYLATLGPGATWANDGADSGDLLAALLTGGIPHPSGYPSYLLLGRAALALPLGGAALRVGLLWAACAAAAAATLAWTAAQLSGEPRWVAGVVAGGLFGGAAIVWSQAVIGEVYALHALLAALLLALVALGARWRGAWAVAALALGNHLTAAPLVAAWAWRRRGAGAGWQYAACAALTIALYAWLLLLARGGPPVSWGDATTPDRLLWLVSGAAYRPLMFAADAATLRARLGELMGDATHWMALWLAAALGGYGAWRRRAAPRALLPGLAACAGIALFALLYDAPSWRLYLAPPLASGCLLAGVGGAELVRCCGRWRALAGGALAAAIGIAILATWPLVDASTDHRAAQYADAVMGQAPRGALVLTVSDEATFPLWYTHFGLGRRDDLRLANETLLDFEWYRANLRRTYPDLTVPDAPSGSWGDTLAARNPQIGAVCRASETAELACFRTLGY